MCRSIKVLRSANKIPSDQDIHAAALQFVRKISGYRIPSQANEAAFRLAVGKIAAASKLLLRDLNCSSSKAGARSNKKPLPSNIDPSIIIEPA